MAEYATLTFVILEVCWPRSSSVVIDRWEDVKGNRCIHCGTVFVPDFNIMYVHYLFHTLGSIQNFVQVGSVKHPVSGQSWPGNLRGRITTKSGVVKPLAGNILGSKRRLKRAIISFLNAFSCGCCNRSWSLPPSLCHFHTCPCSPIAMFHKRGEIRNWTWALAVLYSTQLKGED